MSNPSTGQNTPSEAADDERNEWGLETAVPSLAKPIRVTGFWGGILLPVCYLPLLITGLSSSLEALLFLSLVMINLVALYVGRVHHRE